MLVISACSVKTRNSQTADSAVTSQTHKGLFAVLKIKDTINAGDSVSLRFTVYNPSGTAQQFCKWHTPFEPLMSKYLDVKNNMGEEAGYRGPMAKRIMPPPAGSYIKVKAHDSLTTTTDLLKGYDISKPGKYIIVYNSQNISGIVVKDSVSFVYKGR